MEEKKEKSAAAYYSKGNESFVSDNYASAVDLYSQALQLEPQFADCLVARAHAYIKSDKFDLAKKDSEQGIDLLRTSDPSSPALAKAFLRSGVASFHLGRYSEAKNCFLEGQKLGEEAGLKQWMTWCDEKIAKFGPGAGAKKEEVKKEEAKKEPVQTKDTETPADASGAAGGQPAPPVMPVPKVSHDWYQTETQVVVEVRIKNLKASECKIDIQETALSVTAPLPHLASEYSLELDLAHPVVPAQSGYKVLSTKIEIKLRKAEGVRWAALEGDGSAPLPGGTAPQATGQGVKAPYASGRDWAAMEKTLNEEAEEKKEGEAALNEMFQKIYGDANDEVKRAMNKSFQESGGTVLSTNWADIGKEKTEVKPPDGMEWKKYD